eukprot:scaffold2607_cov118-Isochrysis_galbana.AAC.3
MMFAAAAESSPEVGSSKNIIAGCLATASARARRRRCPLLMPLTDMLPARVCWHPTSPVDSSSISIASRLSSRLRCVCVVLGDGGAVAREQPPAEVLPAQRDLASAPAGLPF